MLSLLARGGDWSASCRRDTRRQPTPANGTTRTRTSGSSFSPDRLGSPSPGRVLQPMKWSWARVTRCGCQRIADTGWSGLIPITRRCGWGSSLTRSQPAGELAELGAPGFERGAGHHVAALLNEVTLRQDQWLRATVDDPAQRVHDRDSQHWVVLADGHEGGSIPLL